VLSIVAGGARARTTVGMLDGHRHPPLEMHDDTLPFAWLEATVTARPGRFENGARREVWCWQGAMEDKLAMDELPHLLLQYCFLKMEDKLREKYVSPQTYSAVWTEIDNVLQENVVGRMADGMDQR
jgi:hypothetical protein